MSTASLALTVIPADQTRARQLSQNFFRSRESRVFLGGSRESHVFFFLYLCRSSSTISNFVFSKIEQEVIYLKSYSEHTCQISKVLYFKPWTLYINQTLCGNLPLNLFKMHSASAFTEVPILTVISEFEQHVIKLCNYTTSRAGMEKSEN